MINHTSAGRNEIILGFTFWRKAKAKGPKDDLAIIYSLDFQGSVLIFIHTPF
jgi:hypothetical protein